LVQAIKAGRDATMTIEEKDDQKLSGRAGVKFGPKMDRISK